MATVGKKGDSTRHGAVKKRSQVYNATTNRFIKVDEETGRFMDVKADDKPFASVRTSKAVKKKAKADKKADAKKVTKKKAGKKKAKKKVAKTK